MDIISYGVANKAGKSEQHTRNDVLGQGIEGSFLHTKDRIDKLEEGIQNVVSQADKLIVHDTINIMKAHAQLNAIAKTTRYNMHNMIFDDLFDLSGIDTTRSSGYTHDSLKGSIKMVEEIDTENFDNDTLNLNFIGTEWEQSTFIKRSGTKSLVATNQTSNTKETKVDVTLSEDGNVSFWYSTWVHSDQKAYRLDFDFYVDGVLRYTKGSKYWNQPWTMISEPLTAGVHELKWVYRSSNVNTSRVMAIGIDDLNISGMGSGAEKAIITKEEITEIIPTKVILTVEESSGSGKYYVSRDNGITWESIIPETLFYFKDSISPLDNNLRLKVKLPGGAELLNYSLTWA